MPLWTMSKVSIHFNYDSFPYTIYQINHKNHARSIKGSVGIAIAVKNETLQEHEIVYNDDNVDGQIGLKLNNCKTKPNQTK